MPFVAAYISVMASGGIAPYTSFKRLSEVELMPAMKGEAKEIIKDVEIFGIDPLSALEKAAKENPLDIFKEFLAGYASTVIIGGDIGHFLERKAEDIFKATSPASESCCRTPRHANGNFHNRHGHDVVVLLHPLQR